MNDQNDAAQCDDISCKDDLLQGLLALFTQADAAEAEAAADDAASED